MHRTPQPTANTVIAHSKFPVVMKLGKPGKVLGRKAR
jgi:hypothetical protein